MSAILPWNLAGADESPNALQRFAIPALLATLVMGAAWLILAHPREPVWDQLALLEASFEAPNAPSPTKGFTSQLIVALVRPLLPSDAAPFNAAIRLVAMLLYAVSAAIFASTVLQRRALIALFLVFVFSSQFPFLWLSSELFTAAFLMFAIASWTAGASPWLVGALLALLGLCKPDVIVVSIALLAYWAHRSAGRREALVLAGSFGLTLFALLLPGTLASGLGYFQSYGGSGGRSFMSFSQHYAALIQHFQISASLPNPWTETSAYTAPHFPGAGNMFDVVVGHFPRYVEFVALSTVRGVFRAGWVANYAVLAVPCLVWGWRRAHVTPGEREKTLLLCFVGVLPFVLFAYPHVRYLARYYPVFILLLLIAFERLLAARDRDAYRPALLTAGSCLGVSLLANLGRLAQGVVRIAQDGQYWFPD